MSVILIKQPQLYTPSDNPIIYQFGTTYSDALYFNIKVYDYPSNELIIDDKAYITPIAPTSSVYNLSDVMKSTVNWQMDLYNTGSSLLTNSSSKYYMNVGVYGLQSGLVSQMGATYTTPVNTVWYGELDRYNFGNFNYQQYALGSWSPVNNVHLLTNRPSIRNVNKKSFDHLYYLSATSSSTFTPTYRFYNGTGLVSTYNVTESINEGVNRIVINPSKILTDGLPTGTFSSDGTFHHPTYGSIVKYDVTFKSSATASNTVTYNYNELPCNVELINIIWVNRLGGIDCYQFRAPLETRDVERTTIQKDEWDWNDSLTEYVDREGGVLNPKEEIIDIKANSSVRMWTDKLTDAESYWLGELLESKQVFMQLTDVNESWDETSGIAIASLYPVSIAETSYQINRGRYETTQPVQAQFTFKVVGDVIPSTYLQNIATIRFDYEAVGLQMSIGERLGLLLNPSIQYTNEIEGSLTSSCCLLTSTFTGNGNGQPIPDGGTTGLTSSILVSGMLDDCTVFGVSVNFNIEHNYTDDLNLFLKAPNNQIITLVSVRGGGGSNFINTTISSNGTQSLTLGTSPYNGTFKADGYLSGGIPGVIAPTGWIPTTATFSDLFVNTTPPRLNGNWTFCAFDNDMFGTGSLGTWSVSITYANCATSSYNNYVVNSGTQTMTKTIYPNNIMDITSDSYTRALSACTSSAISSVGFTMSVYLNDQLIVASSSRSTNTALPGGGAGHNEYTLLNGVGINWPAIQPKNGDSIVVKWFDEINVTPTTTTTTTTSTTTTTTTTGATSCSSYTISGGGGLGSEWLFALCGSATPSYVGLDSGISLEYCINNNFGLTLISGNGTASAPISCTSSPATTTTTTSTTTTTTTAAPTYDIVVYTSAQSPGGYICQVWYKIGAGSWVQLSSPTAVTCTGTNGGGTITGITSGTTVYISMTDNSSNDILYAANSGSSACSGSTSYCGISSPYSAVIVANVSVYLAGDSAATTC